MKDLTKIWLSHDSTVEDPEVRTRITLLEKFEAYAATNRITGNKIFLLRIDKSLKLSDLSLSKFRGVVVHLIDYTDYKELTIILLDAELTDVFVLFVENVIEVIRNCDNELDALVQVSKTISYWKKLFDKIQSTPLSIEQQKGLIGELLALHELLTGNEDYSGVVDAWTGPASEDKDFLFGSVGLEIKFTSLKNPVLKISNERQLDSRSLSSLFLALYIVEEVQDNGLSLASLIAEIKGLLSQNVNALKNFEQKLSKLGYDQEDAEQYSTQYSVAQERIYRVTSGFPSINYIDLKVGVHNVTYNIELSACDPFRISGVNLNMLVYG